MPAPVPTPSPVARLRHVCGPGGFSSMWTYSGGSPTTADLDALATAARSSFTANLAPLLSSAFALAETYAIDLANPSTPQGTDLTAVPGTRVGTAVPNQVCAVLDFTVGRRYRGSKPKCYLPFGVDTDLANTVQWSTAFQTALDSAWTAYGNTMLGTAFGPCSLLTQTSVSYYSGKVANPNPASKLRWSPVARAIPLVSPVLSHGMRLTVGSQRRRRPSA